MYFIIFKGTVGREVYLTDEEGLNSISTSFAKEEPYKFLSYNPQNLEEKSLVVKKTQTVYGYEVKPELEHSETK